MSELPRARPLRPNQTYPSRRRPSVGAMVAIQGPWRHRSHWGTYRAHRRPLCVLRHRRRGSLCRSSVDGLDLGPLWLRALRKMYNPVFPPRFSAVLRFCTKNPVRGQRPKRLTWSVKRGSWKLERDRRVRDGRLRFRVGDSEQRLHSVELNIKLFIHFISTIHFSDRYISHLQCHRR